MAATDEAGASASPQPPAHPGARATAATVNPPYYFRWAHNRAWCITDPGGSATNGTKAVLDECHTSTPGQQYTFSLRTTTPNGTQWWWIMYAATPLKSMCIEDPAHAGAGTQADWWGCEDVTWHYWTPVFDSGGHVMWANGYNVSLGLGLKNADPFPGAIIQMERLHYSPNPADSDQEWCVTDAAGNHLDSLCN
jgi:hypothetical protein